MSVPPLLTPRAAPDSGELLAGTACVSWGHCWHWFHWGWSHHQELQGFGVRPRAGGTGPTTVQRGELLVWKLMLLTQGHSAMPLFPLHPCYFAWLSIVHSKKLCIFIFIGKFSKRGTKIQVSMIKNLSLNFIKTVAFWHHPIWTFFSFVKLEKSSCSGQMDL